MRVVLAVLCLTTSAALPLAVSGPAGAAPNSTSAASKSYTGTLAATTSGNVTVATAVKDGPGRHISVTDYAGELGDAAGFRAKVGDITFAGPDVELPCQQADLAVQSRGYPDWANQAQSQGSVTVTCPRGDGWTDRYFFGRHETITTDCVSITRTANGFRFVGTAAACTVTHISYPQNSTPIVRHDNLEDLSVDLTVVLKAMPPLAG